MVFETVEQFICLWAVSVSKTACGLKYFVEHVSGPSRQTKLFSLFRTLAVQYEIFYFPFFRFDGRYMVTGERKKK